MDKKQQKKIDSSIEQAYYRLAQGKEIGILDIPKLFRESEAAILAGSSVDAAVSAAIEKYCKAA